MRAMLSETPGGPESLKLVELPSKPLGKGQVRVAVRAAGVSVFQRSQRKSAPVSRLSRERMRHAAVWIAGGSASRPSRPPLRSRSSTLPS